MSRLTNPRWWKDAAIRAAYTAIAIALPYFAIALPDAGSNLITGVQWVTILLAAGLGAVASLATSLAGLPETVGVDLPWWLAALERVAKTFGQALVAGIGTAVLLTDLDWGFILQTAVLASFVSLLRLILATLPADPTRFPAQPVEVVNDAPVIYDDGEAV